MELSSTDWEKDILNRQKKNQYYTEEELFNIMNDYTVNTLTHLCGRAIEHFSQIGDEKYKEYMNIMKEVLSLDGVDKLTKENENEIKENSDI